MLPSISSLGTFLTFTVIITGTLRYPSCSSITLYQSFVAHVVGNQKVIELLEVLWNFFERVFLVYKIFSHVIINAMRTARTVCNIQITFPIFSNGFFTFGIYAVLHWFISWWRKWSSNQWIRNWVNHWRGVTSSRIVIIKWMAIWRRHKCNFF